MKAVDTDARYRLLAENASDIVCLVGIDGTLEWMSPSVMRVLGWDPEALVGTQPWELVHADDRAAALAALAQADTVGSDLPDLTLRMRTSAGEYVWLAAKATHATPQSLVVSFRLVDEQVRAMQALAASEERYRTLVENASDVIMRQSMARIVEYVSPSVEHVLGWRPDELVGRPSHAFWHPDDGAEAQVVREAVASGRTARIRGRGLCKDGTYRWLEVTGEPLRDGNGTVVASVSVIRDVDAQVRAEQALAEAEERFRLLAENAMDVVMLSGPDGGVEWVSPSIEAVLGFAPAEVVGRHAADFVHPDDHQASVDLARRVQDGENLTYRLRLMTRDRRPVWMEVTSRRLVDESGAVTGRVVAGRNIDREVAAEARLDEQMVIDELTGLANRAVALERITAAVAQARRRPVTILGVGVDGMTAINQAYTHAAGDAVLREVAERLVAVTGSRDSVARIAGDEFMVLLPSLGSPAEAARYAEEVIDRVRGPVTMGEVQVPVSVCVGIAHAVNAEPGALLRDAAAASRQAAARGAGRWQFLDGDVQERTRRDLDVQVDLRSQLEGDGIRAWFMPLVRLADGRLAGYEALVRLHRPDGTVLGPDAFLAVAERTGLMAEVDRSMLRQALAALSAAPADLTMAVNMSPAILTAGTMVADVVGAAEAAGVDLHRLHLEVTETALLTVSVDIREAMADLASRGVMWWVDDFGTGFSSVSHLRDLPIAGLKLDRSFTEGVAFTGSQDTRLAQALAGLAQGLGLDTVAEGIETQEQSEVLMGQGWRLGQGWLFGAPAPAIARGPALS